MATAASRFPQVYQNLPVFPGMPLPSFDLVKRSAFTPPPMQQQVHKNTVYSQAELDMLLYGYGISKSADGANHALSGLRVSQFGMYTFILNTNILHQLTKKIFGCSDIVLIIQDKKISLLESFENFPL